MLFKKITCSLIFIFSINLSLGAEINKDAELIFKITLAKPPTSMPQTVAYIPVEKKYYIADGGLAPMGSAYEAPISKSLIHTYDANGIYIESTRAGFDNRSIYFNEKTSRLETITYNVSSAAGFAPMTGIFSLKLNEHGLLTGKSDAISNFTPAFGSASTMPSYNSKENIYYAKQDKSNSVYAINAENYQLISDIKLDYETPKVQADDVAENFIAFTGRAGEEFILLDVDHKRFLVYDIKGSYKGASNLPGSLKLRAKNHFNGLGYTLNGYYFLYIESEGEFGTFYAYKVLS
jgi:hypothetical protein